MNIILEYMLYRNIVVAEYQNITVFIYSNYYYTHPIAIFACMFTFTFPIY